MTAHGSQPDVLFCPKKQNGLGDTMPVPKARGAENDAGKQPVSMGSQGHQDGTIVVVPYGRSDGTRRLRQGSTQSKVIHSSAGTSPKVT